MAGAGPSIRDAVSELIESRVLRPAPDHDEDDILDAIRAITGRYSLPLFYPPGSSQHESAMKFAAPPARQKNARRHAPWPSPRPPPLPHNCNAATGMHHA